MSKQPPKRPKDTRPEKDKPEFPRKPKKYGDDFDAYIRELVDNAPPLDPGSAQFQRLRAICAPTYQRVVDHSPIAS